jgi:integrase/recombinase XerD
MLKLYRRHEVSCPHRSKGQRHWTCKCRVWVRGAIDDRKVRQSTGLTDWDKALDLVRRWELVGGIFPKAQEIVFPTESPKTLDEAWQDFLDRKEKNENLSHTSLDKYRRLRRRLTEFARRHGIRLLKDFKLDSLELFQSEWSEAAITRSKELDRVKHFFRSSRKRGWLTDNPAEELRPPKFRKKEIKPFTVDEMKAILSATERFPDKSGRLGQANAKRLRALILLLRFSGLRIGDAVSCSVDQIKGNRLYRRTQKTDTPVTCWLPNEVVSLLATLPRRSQKYFFWTGESTLHTAVGIWQRTLRALFRLAGIEGGHAHRFRDTFSVECLESGLTIERVSTLLAHSDIRVTQKHYNPWVQERQKRLEDEIQRSLQGDELLSWLRSGTQAVRREEPQTTNLFIIGGKGMVPAGGIEPTA